MKSKISKYNKLLFTVVLLLLSNTATSQGPNAPEAASFEPVDATDMVNLVTGNMTYVLPLLNVPSPEGGYPIALSYHAGIAAEQEASWVGLGWSLNPGAINRAVNGYPDDWGKTNVNEFFYDSGYSEDYYNFSAGVTLYGGISLGLGLSWGSNQSLGGYVSASAGLQGPGSLGIGASLGTNSGSLYGGIGGFNASLSTGGVGIGYGLNSSVSSNIGINLNYNHSNGLSGGISISAKQKGIPISSGLGINFSSNTFSVNGRINGQGIGSSNPTNPVSSGDIDISVSSTGFFIPAHIFYIGYNHTKVKYSLFKYTDLNTSGILYPMAANSLKPYNNSSGLSRLLFEDNFMDVKTIPKYDIERDVISLIEEDNLISRNNLVLPNYDNYTVSAQGLSGTLKPYFLTELNLSGRGRGNQNDDNEYMAYLNHDFTEYNSAASSGISVNREAIKKVNFTFDNAYNSFLRTETTSIFNSINLPDASIGDNTVLDYFKTNSTNNFNNFNNVIQNRKREGNHIETYTNLEIREGLIDSYIEANGINRSETNTFLDEGIGAYQITTPDGRTYHYSLPVYNFESFFRNFKDDTNMPEDDKNFFEIRKTTPYATHWLLTAITGPDYIDLNNNGELDELDYGYWVEFEYGKWSDGHIWRTPTVDGEYNEIENENGDITYSYSWGRKQIYYLDEIKTRTHTALFIKKLRDDAQSIKKEVFNTRMNSGNFSHLNYKKIKSNKYKNHYVAEGVIYTPDGSPRSLEERLFGYRISAYKSLDSYVDFQTTSLLSLDRIVLIKNKDAVYDKRSGSITNSVLGHIGNNIGYESTTATGNFADTYQFPPNITTATSELHQNILDIADVEGLSLENKAQQIILFEHDYSLAKNSPNSKSTNNGRLSLKAVNFGGKMGAQIVPPYRFSYDRSNTSFSKNNIDDWGYVTNFPSTWSLNKIQTPTGGELKINYEKDSYYAEAATYENKYFESIDIVQLTNLTGSSSAFATYKVTFNDNTNILDYFEIGKECGLSFKLCQNSSYTSNTPLEVIGISGNEITLKANNNTEVIEHSSLSCVEGNNAVAYFYDLKIKSNKVPFYTKLNPNGKEGGDLRVKSIQLVNTNQTITTEYNYNNPNTDRISGITSYAPSDDPKGIPYVSELPAPLVMYGHVKMTTKDSQGNIIGSTAYNFETLTPFSQENGYVFSIGNAFKVKEQQNQKFNNDKVMANKYTILNRLGNIGRLLSITNYNENNQKLVSNTNQYKTNLDNDQEIGVTQESHKSLKRVLTGTNNSNLVEKFYVSSTSRVSYPSVLESSTKIQSGFSRTTNFTKYDFLTGKILESNGLNSKGQEYKTQTTLAYTIPEYEIMGSKLDNPSNKNMLTQEAMNKTYIKIDDVWQETSAAITTWKSWNNDVWRKHKSFTWNGDRETNGLFKNFTGNDDGFNWSLIAAAQPTNSNWKQLSEITKYNNFSAPLEIEDINGNRAATKMCDSDSKIMATSNAAYSEMHYSGAEYVKDGLFDGAIDDIGRTNSRAHTGEWSIGVSTAQGFKTALSGHTPGKYKISVWASKDRYQNARVYDGTGLKAFNGETVLAGDWVLLNHYVDLTAADKIIYVSSNSGTVHYDDFRVHPVASSMTAYVYNEWDELTHIIGSNNMATRYEYDNMGRLSKTYTEIHDPSPATTGGFKLIGEYQMNYKNQ